jgi:hypothetical protein
MTSAIKTAATSKDDVLTDSDLDAVVGAAVDVSAIFRSKIENILGGIGHPPPPPPPPPPSK